MSHNTTRRKEWRKKCRLNGICYNCGKKSERYYNCLNCRRKEAKQQNRRYHAKVQKPV